MSDIRIDIKRNRRIIPRKEKPKFLERFLNNAIISKNKNKYRFISQKKVQRKNILLNYLKLLEF